MFNVHRPQASFYATFCYEWPLGPGEDPGRFIFAYDDVRQCTTTFLKPYSQCTPVIANLSHRISSSLCAGWVADERLRHCLYLLASGYRTQDPETHPENPNNF